MYIIYIYIYIHKYRYIYIHTHTYIHAHTYFWVNCSKELKQLLVYILVSLEEKIKQKKKRERKIKLKKKNINFHEPYDKKHVKFSIWTMQAWSARMCLEVSNDWSKCPCDVTGSLQGKHQKVRKGKQCFCNIKDGVQTKHVSLNVKCVMWIPYLSRFLYCGVLGCHMSSGLPLLLIFTTYIKYSAALHWCVQ